MKGRRDRHQAEGPTNKFVPEVTDLQEIPNGCRRCGEGRSKPEAGDGEQAGALGTSDSP